MEGNGYKLLWQDAGINFGAALATQGKDFSIEVNGETLTFAAADALPEYQTVPAFSVSILLSIQI